MAITQKQIAEHLGMSRSSVRDALQGRRRVTELTRQRVFEAARQMGYSETSNMQARSLVAKRYGSRIATGVLAVVLPTVGEKSQVASPFHAELLSGIEIAADERGIDIYICAWRQGRPVPRFIANQFVDAVICLGLPYDWEESIVQSALPIVSFFQAGEYGSPFDSCRILVDNRAGARQAVHHLVELGHRRIAYLGQPATFHNSIERLAGYREGLAEAGITPDEALVEASIHMISVKSDALAKLRARASDWTALVCYNDKIAMDAITELASEGLSVPRDISVVGFDDISIQEHYSPTVTSIAFDRVAMGRSAVELIENIPVDWSPAAGKDCPVIKQFPVGLVVRESTASMSSS